MKTTFYALAFSLALISTLLGDVKELRLSIQSDAATEGAYLLVIENVGSNSASYFGYGGEGSAQPVYRIEVKDGERWVDRSLGWCGVGIGPCDIGGKKEIRTPFHGFPEDDKPIQFRISVSASGQHAAHWDDKSAIPVFSPIYESTNGRIEQVGGGQPAIDPESNARNNVKS